MQYVPFGFWPRLTTRLLNDEKLCTMISEIFVWDDGQETNDADPISSRFLKLSNDCALFNDLNEALNASLTDDKSGGGFEFLLWQTGLECNWHSNYLFSLKVRF